MILSINTTNSLINSMPIDDDGAPWKQVIDFEGKCVLKPYISKDRMKM